MKETVRGPIHLQWSNDVSSPPGQRNKKTRTRSKIVLLGAKFLGSVLFFICTELKIPQGGRKHRYTKITKNLYPLSLSSLLSPLFSRSLSVCLCVEQEGGREGKGGTAPQCLWVHPHMWWERGREVHNTATEFAFSYFPSYYRNVSILHGEVVHWNLLEYSSPLGRRRNWLMSWFCCFSINCEKGQSQLMYWSRNLRK